MAIMIRCRMPPLNWCGYWPSRRPGSGMPTIASSSTARRRASAPAIPRWISSPSLSWRSMVSTGFSDVIGSWKIMAISRPRTRRISSSFSVKRSRPLKSTCPPTMRPAGAATSRMMLRAETLLPHPDSPTSATVSPALTSQETSSTARTMPAPVWNCVLRCRTSRRIATVRGSLTHGDRGAGVGSPDHALWREAADGGVPDHALGEDAVGANGSLPHPGPPRPAAAPTRAPGGIGPLVLAAGGGQMHAGPRLQARILPADGLGHARPAMARRPADALASHAPAEVRIAEHRVEAAGQRLGVAVRNQEPGDAVPDRGGQAAHARGDDGARAGHRLQGHHPERFVVRGQDRRVGSDVIGPQRLLGLGADEAHGVAQAQPRRPPAQLGLVTVERLVGVPADDEEPQAAPAVPQAGDGVEQRVEPLDRGDATRGEHDRALAEPEGGPGLGAGARAEELGVDSARDDGGAAGGRARGPRQLSPLHGPRDR